MFEKFTDTARRLLVLTQEQSRLLNHNFIGTEHILLGLLQIEEQPATRALKELIYEAESSPERVRKKIEELFPPGPGAAGSPPFTPRVKKLLELSLREALQLGHNYIGVEHLVLAVVREGYTVPHTEVDRNYSSAIHVLLGEGVDVANLRRRVLDAMTTSNKAAEQERAEELVEMKLTVGEIETLKKWIKNFSELTPLATEHPLLLLYGKLSEYV